MQTSPATSALDIRTTIYTTQFPCVVHHPVKPSWFRSATSSLTSRVCPQYLFWWFVVIDSHYMASPPQSTAYYYFNCIWFLSSSPNSLCNQSSQRYTANPRITRLIRSEKSPRNTKTRKVNNWSFFLQCYSFPLFLTLATIFVTIRPTSFFHSLENEWTTFYINRAS